MWVYIAASSTIGICHRFSWLPRCITIQLLYSDKIICAIWFLWFLNGLHALLQNNMVLHRKKFCSLNNTYTCTHLKMSYIYSVGSEGQEGMFLTCLCNILYRCITVIVIHTICVFDAKLPDSDIHIASKDVKPAYGNKFLLKFLYRKHILLAGASARWCRAKTFKIYSSTQKWDLWKYKMNGSIELSGVNTKCLRLL